MEKTQQERLKEVIHLYLGCDVTFRRKKIAGWSVAKLICVSTFGSYVIESKDKQFSIDAEEFEFKPILRSLDDMTEEEAKEFCKKEGWGENLENLVVLDGAIEFSIKGTKQQCVSRFTRMRPEMFAWCLSKRFDLFNLIPDGIAINAKELQK